MLNKQDIHWNLKAVDNAIFVSIQNALSGLLF